MRHAQSESNRLWAEGGPAGTPDPDPPLSALGERQAVALARAAGHLVWRPTHVYASVSERARATAAPLAAALGLPVLEHATLHEVGAPETPGQAARRAERLVVDLRARHQGHDVVVLVTHVWFGQFLLRSLMRAGDAAWFTLHHTGVCLVADADPGLPVPVEVGCLNSTAHLPAAWITA